MPLRPDLLRLTMLDLDSGQIHLWLAFLDEIRDAALLRRYDRLLSPDEREQRHRFHFEIDRHRYLVTRALARTMLSQYTTLAPEDLKFSSNAYGKPAIANADSSARHLSFNISHTKSLALLGVTSGVLLGVDVENCRSREPPLEIAHRFFALEEVAELQALPREKQSDRFFEYWTLKESYIKARGMGLSLPLSWFSFHFPDERTVGVSMRPELHDRSSRWRFSAVQADGIYLLAVCAEAAESSPQLVIRKVIPLVHEEILDCALVRMPEIR